ncbi:MAG: hypothetical protein WKF34_02280 [Pyrinomonadaceae bacterium]
MRIAKLLSKTFLVIAIGLIGATSHFAFCACCVERGFYEITRSAPDKFYLDMLGEMKFARPAELYMTEAGFDGIKGLKVLENEISDAGPDFSIVETFAKRTWRLDVSTPSGKRGSLALPMPAQMVRYKVDTRFDNRAGSPDVVLYKEFFFAGNVGGSSGIFSSARGKGTAYTLVFQGRGNGCDNASDFKYWRLELKGPRTSFAILGELMANPA